MSRCFKPDGNCSTWLLRRFYCIGPQELLAPSQVTVPEFPSAWQLLVPLQEVVIEQASLQHTDAEQASVVYGKREKVDKATEIAKSLIFSFSNILNFVQEIAAPPGNHLRQRPLLQL